MIHDPTNAVVTIVLLVGFAVLVTVHVATLFGLGKRGKVSTVLSGFVFPPAAPYLAFVRGMRVRAILWVVAASVYVVALLLAR